MILKMILVIAVLAILVDIYIYRRVIRVRWNRWGRVAYVVYAVAADLVIVAAVLLYRASYTSGEPGYIHAVGWCFALFFTNLVPKAIYLLLSLPDYLSRWISHRHVRVFGYIASALGIWLFGAMVWGMSVGRGRIEVKRIELTSEKLPAAFDGLRVVEFADLHLGNLVNRDKFLNRMVDSINSLRPDIVIQCGDIVNIESGELDRAAMEILSRIESRYGVYSVLGNHDIAFYISDTVRTPPAESIRDLIVKQTALGWHLLMDRTEYVVDGNDSIAISGVNFPAGDTSHNGLRDSFAGTNLDACYAQVPDSLYNIVLSHTPKLWDEILGCGGSADLVLSGHVHAMQMKFGIGRHVWSPAEFMYPQWSGLYERGGKYLYVNDGAGYVLYPMRINARPEITLFTIRRP